RAAQPSPSYQTTSPLSRSFPVRTSGNFGLLEDFCSDITAPSVVSQGYFEAGRYRREIGNQPPRRRKREPCRRESVIGIFCQFAAGSGQVPSGTPIARRDLVAAIRRAREKGDVRRGLLVAGPSGQGGPVPRSLAPRHRGDHPSLRQLRI